MPRPRRGKTLTVNFKGVEVGGRVVEPGEYVAEVVSAKAEESQKSGKPYIAWTLKIVGNDDFDGARLYHNTSLQPQSLWTLRQMLEALGLETPDGAMELDLESYVGLQLGVEVDIEQYDGKDKSRVVDVFSLEESEEEETEEEAEEVEEVEEEEAEEEAEEEVEEVEEEAEEEEEEPAPRRKRRARR